MCWCSNRCCTGYALLLTGGDNVNGEEGAGCSGPDCRDSPGNLIAGIGPAELGGVSQVNDERVCASGAQ